MHVRDDRLANTIEHLQRVIETTHGKGIDTALLRAVVEQHESEEVGRLRKERDAARARAEAMEAGFREAGAAPLRYSHQRPTAPGWWWCRNNDTEAASGVWEAMVKIERTTKGLFCLWLHGVNQTPDGRVGLMHESDWSPETLWCGPLTPPLDAPPTSP